MLKEKSFGRQIAFNLIWQTMAVGARVVVSAITLAVLARIAGPETFGIYGLSWAGPAMAFAAVQSGVAQGLILVDNFRPSHVAAARTLALITAVGAALIIAALGPFVAEIYHKPRLATAYFEAAMFVPTMALSVADMAAAQRELNFKLLAGIQTGAIVLSSLASVVIALLLDPLWGLFALLGLVGVFQFALFRFSKYQNIGLKASRQDFLDIWRHGRHLLLNVMTANVLVNSPQFLIGYYLPIDQLGLFTLCRRVIEIINNQIGGIANQVIFPSFAKEKNENVQIGQTYLIISRLTAMIMMVPLLILASDPAGFLILYGGRAWGDGAATLLMLVMMQAGYSLGQNLFSVMQAVGMASVVWKWNLFLICIQSALITLFGTNSAQSAAAMMAASTVVMPLAAFILNKHLKFGMSKWFANAIRILVPPLVIAALVHLAMDSYLKADASVISHFLVAASASSITYGVMLLFIEPLIRVRVGKWFVARFSREK